MQGTARSDQHRAAPPELPAATPALERDRQESARYRKQREVVERRSVVRGLIVLAILLLVASMARAGLDRVFVHGWWRP